MKFLPTTEKWWVTYFEDNIVHNTVKNQMWKEPVHSIKKTKNDLKDIEIAVQGIKDAIDELDKNSAVGPDGIPAMFLIKTKEAIAEPLAKMLRKSLDEGKIPDILKMAYVSPIHKGGSR